MAYNDFMNKVRHWDNLSAKWLMRHFYFTFFQIVLVVIFLFWFINTLNILDATYQTADKSPLEHFLALQGINSIIITFLVLLNSFWMLYIFNGFRRANGLLKDMSYHLSKMHYRDRNANQQPRAKI